MTNVHPTGPQHLPIGIYRATPDGKYLDVNEGMATIFEASSVKELLEVGPTALYPSRVDRDRVFSRPVIEEQAVKNHVMRLQTLDGEPRWIETSAVYRVEVDESPRFDGIAYDVTDRERRLQQILQSRDYLFGLNEDLRTVLRFIQDELARDGHPPRQRQPGTSTQVIAQNLRTLDRVIENLLDLSQAGPNSGTREIDLTGLAQGCWELLDTDASLDIRDDLRLKSDPYRTREVVKSVFEVAVWDNSPGRSVSLGMLEEDLGFYIEGPGLVGLDKVGTPTPVANGPVDGVRRSMVTFQQAITQLEWDVEVSTVDDELDRVSISDLSIVLPV